MIFPINIDDGGRRPYSSLGMAIFGLIWQLANIAAFAYLIFRRPQ